MTVTMRSGRLLGEEAPFLDHEIAMAGVPSATQAGVQGVGQFKQLVVAAQGRRRRNLFS